MSSKSEFSLFLDRLLTRAEAPDFANWMGRLIDGDLGEAESAAFLVAMRVRGESAKELAAAANAIRDRMTPLDLGTNAVLDTCGTGGDGAGTFNVSTAVAFVVAGAGVPVVKHGNRAVSSASGSSDVLLALGLPLNAGLGWTRRCFEQAGFAFCFAPNHHPALAKMAPLRKRLGIRTIFNAIGPLVNPARPKYQLVGVGDENLLEPMAQALATLGVRRAMVVHGESGLDEVGLTGKTRGFDVRAERIEPFIVGPEDFGLEPIELNDVLAKDPSTSAAMIVAVLQNSAGPATRLVLANAAMALMAAEKADRLDDAMELAKQSVSTGRAWAVLEKMRAVSPD